MQINLVPAGGIEILLNTAEFNESTIHKCFYWYTRDFNVAISALPEHEVLVSITAKDSTTAVVWDQLPPRIHNDLIDFRLREIVAQETGTIRELLVAKAFANYDTQQPLQSEVSDPVGFHPTPASQS